MNPNILLDYTMQAGDSRTTMEDVLEVWKQVMTSQDDGEKGATMTHRGLP